MQSDYDDLMAILFPQTDLYSKTITMWQKTRYQESVKQSPTPTDVTTTRSTREPNHCWRQWWRIGWTRWQFLYSRINLLHTGFFPFTLSRMWRANTQIFWMSSIYLWPSLQTSTNAPSIWLFKMLKPVTSTIVGDIVTKSSSSQHVFTMCSPTLFHFLFTSITSRKTCLLLMFFTSCFTCVCLKANTFFYLFKPVVRWVYSLAFHWESYHP